MFMMIGMWDGAVLVAVWTSSNGLDADVMSSCNSGTKDLWGQAVTVTRMALVLICTKTTFLNMRH